MPIDWVDGDRPLRLPLLLLLSSTLGSECVSVKKLWSNAGCTGSAGRGGGSGAESDNRGPTASLPVDFARNRQGELCGMIGTEFSLRFLSAPQAMLETASAGVVAIDHR